MFGFMSSSNLLVMLCVLMMSDLWFATYRDSPSPTSDLGVQSLIRQQSPRRIPVHLCCLQLTTGSLHALYSYQAD